MIHTDTEKSSELQSGFPLPATPCRRDDSFQPRSEGTLGFPPPLVSIARFPHANVIRMRGVIPCRSAPSTPTNGGEVSSGSCATCHP